MCCVQYHTLTFFALDARDKPGHDGERQGAARISGISGVSPGTGKPALVSKNRGR